MIRLFKSMAVLLGLGLVCSLSVYGGYKLYSSGEDEVLEKKFADENLNVELQKVSNINEEKITASTKMVYEYFYETDKSMEVVEDTPPYYLIDIGREELIKNYDDWKVLKFSDKEVVMRKNISGEGRQNYIIGIYEGYVAVFYDKEINGTKLMEITNTPVEALPDEEKERLKKGIAVKGQNELIRILENYDV